MPSRRQTMAVHADSALFYHLLPFPLLCFALHPVLCTKVGIIIIVSQLKASSALAEGRTATFRRGCPALMLQQQQHAQY